MTDAPSKPSNHPLKLRPFVGRMVIVALVFGIIGGVLATLAVVRFAPGLIPVSKQSILLEQSSATIEVVKKASPSVVSITSESSGFSFFGSSQTTQGAGTGVIATSDGLIITNNHVIEGATNLIVFTSDGKEYNEVEVVARDPQNDIAFLRIKASGLDPAELGDSSQVKVGTQVLAIGNALGQFENTVTTGIISGLGRPVSAGDQQGNRVELLQNLFQTDAAINPGNSGGPLVDLTGKVIGINTAVAGNAQGIGFAIPINQVAQQLEAVKTQGKIVKAYIGVRYIPVTKEFAASNDLKVNEGAYIVGNQGQPGVVPDSPAAKAGLREGDIITKVGGKAIDEDQSLSTLINGNKPGDKVELTVLRDGNEQKIEVTLGEAPQAD